MPGMDLHVHISRGDMRIYQTFEARFQASAYLASVTRKKLPNVYKSCPKMISLEKWKILTPLQKLPKNVGDLG